MDNNPPYVYNDEMISYNDIIEALSMNREIEFLYESDEFAILTLNEHSWFHCKARGIKKPFEDSITLIHSIRIDGKTFKELFDENKIEIQFIY